MKIIQLITRLDKGGSSENVIDLSTALFKKGFDVVFIYGAKQRLIFPFVSYYIKTFERDINPIKDFLSFLKILLILIKEKPDIVHTHTSKAGFIGRWACWLYRMVFKRNLKIIHTPHGHIFYGYFGRFKSYLFVLIERVTSIITDVLVALTENERKESLEYGVGKQDKWVVIPSGIDYRFEIKEKDLRRKLNIEDNKIIVGSVMRLEDIKGDIYFVLAAGQVLKKSSDIFFILVGDGKNRKKIEDEVKKLGIEKNFVLVGWQTNVYDWINIMDIYLQPSLNEGLGRTIIIAELLSKPIVASDVCGIRDLVRDGINGFLVKPKDVYAFALAIIKLARDVELRYNMGKESYIMVNESVDGFKKYSFERCLYLYTKLYKSIL